MLNLICRSKQDHLLVIVIFSKFLSRLRGYCDICSSCYPYLWNCKRCHHWLGGNQGGPSFINGAVSAGTIKFSTYKGMRYFLPITYKAYYNEPQKKRNTRFFYRNPKKPNEVIERSRPGNLGKEFVEKLRKEFNLGKPTKYKQS